MYQYVYTFSAPYANNVHAQLNYMAGCIKINKIYIQLTKEKKTSDFQRMKKILRHATFWLKIGESDKSPPTCVYS